ncbi:MAG: hypothetical protein MN733_17245, partial [Nitrososphaera sp.]|nr:hypothetical protein [Nitrososphaera sp.]
ISKRRTDRATGEKVGKKARRAIITPEGYWLARADWCVAPETRLLTEKLSWERANDLKEGQILVGFDEKIGGYSPKFKPAEITSVCEVLKPSVRIITDKATVVCSIDHLWPVRRKVKGTNNNNKHLSWVRTDELNVKDSISYFAEPWVEDCSKEAGYIAGLMDGEGSLSVGEKHAGVTISQNEGVVLDELTQILRQKGFSFSVKPVKRKKKLRIVYFTGSNRPGIRSLGIFRPRRLLAKATERMLYGRRIWSGHSKRAKVLKIENLGIQKLVSISTTSRTFIAEGLLSHNCNAENLVYLYLAGYDSRELVKQIKSGMDFHTMMADRMGLRDGDEFCIRMGGRREAAKTVSHSTHYLEGLKLVDP